MANFKFESELKKLAKKHHVTTEELKTSLRKYILKNMRVSRREFVLKNLPQCRFLFHPNSRTKYLPWNKTHVKFVEKARRYIGYSDRYACCDIFRSIQYAYENYLRYKLLYK